MKLMSTLRNTPTTVHMEMMASKHKSTNAYISLWSLKTQCRSIHWMHDEKKKNSGTPIQLEGVSLFLPIVQFGAVAKANVITSPIRNQQGATS